MNKRLIFGFASCSLVIASSGLTLHAAEVAAKAPPSLVFDPSPITQAAKPGMVTSYADVVEPVQKAVVSVHSTKLVRSEIPMHPMFRELFGGNVPQKEEKQQALGSGVIVSADGYILTNNHVVEGAEELKVAMTDGREFTAKIIGADPKTDVAVIKIDATELPVVPIADSDKIRVGDVVFALGNPLGVGQTVTMGIVSAIGRSNLGLIGENGAGVGYENFIQTDAAINMGNSGGALVDAKGRLVGINTAIISPSRGNIGIGFAIPTSLAVSTMQNLVSNNGVVRRGVIGVSGKNLNEVPDLAEALGLKPDQKGVIVERLNSPDCPAARAGVKREDVITAINGKPVTSITDLRLMIAQMTPGTKIQLSLLRAGKEKEVQSLSVEVTLGGAAEVVATEQLFAGVNVVPITDELRKELEIDRTVDGLVVQAVDERSPYAARLLPGVVILEINREPVVSLEQAAHLLVKGRNILYVNYRGVYTYIALVR